MHERIFSRALLTAAGATLLTALVGGSAFAQNESRLQLSDPDDWYFTASPYAWFAGIDGDVTVRGFESDVDVDFGDILDVLDFGAIGRFEAGKGPWAIMTDLVYLKVSEDGDTPGPAISDIDVTMRSLILEVGGAYRFYETDDGLLNRPVSIRALAGLRYTDLDADVDITSTLPLPDVDGSKDWIDPYVGLQSTVQWTPRFGSSFRADIGGFGVGSDLVYQLASTYSIALTKSLDLVFGYRTLTYDYEDGSGRRKFEYDTTLSGPVLGMNITF